MTFKSIKSKIAFPAGIGLLITAAILVTYSISSTTANNRLINQTVSTLVERITLEKMQSVASEYALSISRRLEKGMQAAQTLANTAAATHAEDANQSAAILDRSVFNMMLSEVLKSNPDLNGTYSCWEPNIFDNNDAKNLNGENGNNAQTGRFTCLLITTHPGQETAPVRSLQGWFAT